MCRIAIVVVGVVVSRLSRVRSDVSVLWRLARRRTGSTDGNVRVPEGLIRAHGGHECALCAERAPAATARPDDAERDRAEQKGANDCGADDEPDALLEERLDLVLRGVDGVLDTVGGRVVFR